MSRRVLEIAFADEARLRAGLDAARRAGLRVLDVYAPYPVHGLPEAMGLAPSRLPWVCLVLGVAGLAGGLWLQAWTSGVDWPLDVGGKPRYPWPAFIPVAFELVVLLAGLGTVAAFLWRARRARRPTPGPLLARATDDRFVLRVEGVGAGFHPERTLARFRDGIGALETAQVLVEDSA